MRSLVLWLSIGASLLACDGGDDSDSPAGNGGAGGAAGSAETNAGGHSGGASGSASNAGAGAGGSGEAGTNAIDAGRDAGVTRDAGDAALAGDGSIDSGAPNAGPFAIPALPFPIDEGEPIVAPERQWSFVAFPDSRCANGTPTGIAINPIVDAEGLLVFMQGGGACWDAEMCFVTNSSVHLHETVDEPVVLGEAAGLSGLFDHDNAANPFASYAYVYMPYCTGDVHIGTQTNNYDTADGPQVIHHHGALNVREYLERLVPTFPDIERVVVSGISAGGFGASFNWWRYQGAFPNARVDVLDDAGLIVDPAGDRWSIMVDAWAIALPPGCSECATRMSAYLPFYGQHLIAPRRYALIGFLGDAVIGSFFGLTSEEIGAQLLAMRTTAAANQKTFFLEGTQHSIIGEGAFITANDGSTFLPWLIELADDDPAWDHAGP